MEDHERLARLEEWRTATNGNLAKMTKTLDDFKHETRGEIGAIKITIAKWSAIISLLVLLSPFIFKWIENEIHRNNQSSIIRSDSVPGAVSASVRDLGQKQ